MRTTGAVTQVVADRSLDALHSFTTETPPHGRTPVSATRRTASVITTAALALCAGFAAKAHLAVDAIDSAGINPRLTLTGHTSPAAPRTGEGVADAGPSQAMLARLTANLHAPATALAIDAPPGKTATWELTTATFALFALLPWGTGHATAETFPIGGAPLANTSTIDAIFSAYAAGALGGIDASTSEAAPIRTKLGVTPGTDVVETVLADAYFRLTGHG